MKIKSHLLVTLALVIVGQLIFWTISPNYLRVSYSNNIYATIGVQENQESLQSLSEAAHQFGQTITGWLKFPNFMTQLSKAVTLPEGSNISAHLQERQNIIISLATPMPIERETLIQVAKYLQAKIDDYNEVSETEFILTQLDYELLENQKTYGFGAGVAFVVTLIIAVGVWYLRREIAGLRKN